jgi:hypothetical protein
VAHRAVAVELSPLEGPPKAGLLLLEGYSCTEFLVANFEQEHLDLLTPPMNPARPGKVLNIGRWRHRRPAVTAISVSDARALRKRSPAAKERKNRTISSVAKENPSGKHNERFKIALGFI